MADPRIDLETVKKVAVLARLALSDDEAAKMQQQLTVILDYISALQSVDVGDLEPTLHAVAMDSPLRADVVEAMLGREEFLAGAPVSAEGGVAVPRVLDHA